MSETHNTPPFTLTKKEASKKMIKLLPKKGLQYASVQLLLASILIKLLPKLLDKIENALKNVINILKIIQQLTF